MAFGVIEKLFVNHGNDDYIGEAVTQEAHALQCARFAADTGAEDEVVIASLLHDIGHLVGKVNNAPQMSDLGIVDHEGLGSEFLRQLGLPDLVCTLVHRHVDAKRYYVATVPHYLNKLSEASRGTLKHQGGPMSPEEVAAFERDPLKKTILLMRTWDDKAKIKGAVVPPLSAYRERIERLIRRNRTVPGIPIVSGLADSDFAAAAAGCGIDDFLPLSDANSTVSNYSSHEAKQLVSHTVAHTVAAAAPRPAVE